MENLHNRTRQRILLLLMSKPSLSAKQIFARSGLKYKTVYKELQNLVSSGILLKDEFKRYTINPEYGDKLIDYGLKIKGLIKPPDEAVFMNNFIEIREKIDQMEDYLRGIAKTT